jgi:hypothetical protein
VTFVARTDRSFVCLACRHRFWPVRRCPACQETKWLVDLELDPDGAGRPPPIVKSTLGAFGSVGLLGLLGAGTAAGAGSFGLAEVMLVPTVLAFGAAIVSRPATTVGRWSILSGPVARAQASRMTFTGVVDATRGVKLLRAPLSNTACVGYRLAGEAGEMPIDDARARPFDLVLEDGERVRVEAAIATLDLPIDDKADRKQVPSGRATFLKHRGAIAIETARVWEATLAIGARVIVTGAVREEAVAAGYRETRTSRTLFDAPGAPLLIRAAPETRRSNAATSDTNA